VGWFILDFITFVGLLVYFTRKPFRAMFQKRHDTIKAAIEEVSANHNRAKAHADEYRDKLARVAEEIERLLAGAKSDGAVARDRIIDGAKQYAIRLRGDSSGVVTQEEAHARDRLRRGVIDDVMRQAESTLRASMTDDDQTRLLDQAIRELEHADVAPSVRGNRPESRALGDAA